MDSVVKGISSGVLDSFGSLDLRGHIPAHWPMILPQPTLDGVRGIVGANGSGHSGLADPEEEDKKDNRPLIRNHLLWDFR
jgi:hypothetical protein